MAVLENTVPGLRSRQKPRHREAIESCKDEIRLEIRLEIRTLAKLASLAPDQV
ncbi:hypothetical protein RXV86_21275 [Alisedimentitalea sp. MJ-SS2]|uniref:hypothetical protein n=1 Tax=Aliisedimentitalea sp. MJ-SS2 TaxID=3049795 RepID=UPI00290C5734|nr:hypothetical protein [Alisedimentitalea sp. MJ-SS2]MDU8929926.1 hypothetical protein [Alisedimentitalea sp. MJ-SS2]